MNFLILILPGVFLPFLGTILGAGSVFFMKKNGAQKEKSSLEGFAAGVMLASLFFSLLLPALEEKKNFLSVLLSFFSGMGIFLLGENLLSKSKKVKHISGKKKMILAVSLHNLPEGMAVGIAFAGALSSSLSMASAFILSLGIALQNFPEGAIISSPLHSIGFGKKRSFLYGTLSGVVEPLGALFSLILTAFSQRLLPFVLSFAAGAMLFVISDELIPSLKEEEENSGLWALCFGFLVMMGLDVLFG